MLPWTNASLHQPPLYARQKPPARWAVVPLEEARSSSLGWEARAKAQRIVTSSSSVRVGAAVPPKSGCLRYWKACGRVSQLRCMSLKKNLAALIDQFLFKWRMPVQEGFQNTKLCDFRREAQRPRNTKY